MSKNYSKISPRGEQRYRRNSSSSKSGYFVLLLLLIVGITGYYVFSRGILFNNSHKTAVTNGKESKKPAEPPKPRFEFYTVLSKETVPVSHKQADEVSADATTTEAELEAEKKAQEAMKASEAPKTLETAPSGVPSIPVQNNQPKKAVVAAPASVQTKPAAPTPTPPVVATKVVTPTSTNSTSSSRYVLQVAALQNLRDVDQLKAKLAFLGFTSVAEPFLRNGSTWYRVKVGVFSSPEAMQKARQTLANNHLGSIVITLPSR